MGVSFFLKLIGLAKTVWICIFTTLALLFSSFLFIVSLLIEKSVAYFVFDLFFPSIFFTSLLTGILNVPLFNKIVVLVGLFFTWERWDGVFVKL